MPKYEFMCESCEKRFEATLTIAERANAKIQCPSCGGEKVTLPSADGIHRQDLAEELKTKGVL